MLLKDPTQINDWPFGQFVSLVALLTLAFWGLPALSIQLQDFLFLRSIVATGYILVIPGACVLRAMRLHHLGSTLTLLYSVGVSIGVLMFAVAAFDIISLAIGFGAPLSLVPISAIITAVVGGTCAIAYKLDREFKTPRFIRLDFSPPLGWVALLLLPVLAVLGAVMENELKTNLIALAVLVFVALLVGRVSIGRPIARELYPASLFSISLALLYSASLISNHVVEWGDLSFEFWTVNSVVSHSSWNPITGGALGGVLSLTILAPTISLVSGLDPTWTFKLVFPLILSLVPVGVYELGVGFAAPKIAFFSSFFFIAFFSFYTDMLGLNRQVVAELFLVLLVLALMNRGMNRICSAIFGILFSSSLVVSHYALSYIVMIALVTSTLLLVIWKIIPFRGSGPRRNLRRVGGNSPKALRSDRMLVPWFVVSFAVVTVGWYIYVSGGASFAGVLRIADQIRTSILADFLDPSNTQGLAIILSESKTPLSYLYKAIHLGSQGLIVVGMAAASMRRGGINVGREYLFLSVSFLAMDGAGIVVPFFASAINTTRLFSITLIFLAPFGIVGGVIVSKALVRVVRAGHRIGDARAVSTVGVFLVVYFLFNTGFVHHMAGQPLSFTLDPDVIDRPHFTDSDVAGAIWVSQHVGTDRTIFADIDYAYLLEMYRGSFLALEGLDNITSPLHPGDLLFLGTINTAYGTLKLGYPGSPRLSSKVVQLQALAIYKELKLSNRVYENGGTEVFIFLP